MLTTYKINTWLLNYLVIKYVNKVKQYGKILIRRRRKKRQVHSGREDKLFLLTDYSFLKMMRVHIRALHAGKLWGYLSFRYSELSIKIQYKKGSFFSICWNLSLSCRAQDLENSNQSLPGSLDTWFWPWAINSITDVLQKLWLNNYTEERTFSTQPGSLVYKCGWIVVIWTLQNVCRVKSTVWVVIVFELGHQLGWLPCRAFTLNSPHLCLMYMGADVISKTHEEWWLRCYNNV